MRTNATENEHNTEQERFLEMWDWVKKVNNIASDSALLATLGYKARSIISEIRGGKAVNDRLINLLGDNYGVSRKYIKEGSLPKTNTEENGSSNNTNITGGELRAQKAFGPNEDDGLIIVPIAAQAGYSKHYYDPVYIDQLERFKVIDFPYKGDNFRIFEVEGDSMAYINADSGKPDGLQEGYYVVAQKVEKEDWHQIAQWYIHVIVFQDSLLIKRLSIKDEKTFVLTSDNPHYPQRSVNIENIKEIWLVKRYISWNMPPPKQYEITV